MHLGNNLLVRVCGQSKMGETIIRVAIRTTLDENNLGSESSYNIWNNLVKRLQIGLVPCAREKWDVQLEALRLVLSYLIGEPSSGEDVFTVLVEIDIQ